MSITPKFITEDDIVELNKHDVFSNDLQIFLKEIIEYFNSVWDTEYKIKKEYNNFDIFNKEVLENYPSTAGYNILDISFTGSCSTYILSDKSKGILGYLYGIYLR